MEQKQIKRQRCTIYSRVVGYIAPVKGFNTGKKAEYYSRKFYNANQSFINRYGTPLYTTNDNDTDNKL